MKIIVLVGLKMESFPHQNRMDSNTQKMTELVNKKRKNLKEYHLRQLFQYIMN